MPDPVKLKPGVVVALGTFSGDPAPNDTYDDTARKHVQAQIDKALALYLADPKSAKKFRSSADSKTVYELLSGSKVRKTGADGKTVEEDITPGHPAAALIMNAVAQRVRDDAVSAALNELSDSARGVIAGTLGKQPNDREVQSLWYEWSNSLPQRADIRAKLGDKGNDRVADLLFRMAETYRITHNGEAGCVKDNIAFAAATDIANHLAAGHPVTNNLLKAAGPVSSDEIAHAMAAKPNGGRYFSDQVYARMYEMQGKDGLHVPGEWIDPKRAGEKLGYDDVCKIAQEKFETEVKTAGYGVNNATRAIFEGNVVPAMRADVMVGGRAQSVEADLSFVHHAAGKDQGERVRNFNARYGSIGEIGNIHTFRAVNVTRKPDEAGGYRIIGVNSEAVTRSGNDILKGLITGRGHLNEMNLVEASKTFSAVDYFTYATVGNKDPQRDDPAANYYVLARHATWNRARADAGVPSGSPKDLIEEAANTNRPSAPAPAAGTTPPTVPTTAPVASSPAAPAKPAVTYADVLKSETMQSYGGILSVAKGLLDRVNADRGHVDVDVEIARYGRREGISSADAEEYLKSVSIGAMRLREQLVIERAKILDAIKKIAGDPSIVNPATKRLLYEDQAEEMQRAENSLVSFVANLGDLRDELKASAGGGPAPVAAPTVPAGVPQIPVGKP